VALCWVLFFQVGETDRASYFDNPDDHLLPFHSTFGMFKNAFTYRYTAHGGEFRNIFLMNVLGNLVLLLPWGVLAPLAFKKLNGVKWIALSGFLISFSAEIIQYIFSIGIFDIDDLIFNTLGAIIGFYLLQITKYLFFKLVATPHQVLGNEKLDRNNA
jgi:glycopeptide antibiotics resistance protein